MTSEKLKNRLFYIFSAVFILFLIPYEYFNWGDTPLLFYAIGITSLTLSLMFWGYWWWKSRLKPSNIFSMLGILLSCLYYLIIINAANRYFYLYDKAHWQPLTDSIIWEYKGFPIVFPLVLILIWIVSRLFGGEPMKNGERLRVLLVEDDAMISNVMHDIIDSMKTFSIDRAYSYNEAMSMFLPGKYIVVTIDLNLGEKLKQGVDLAEKLRHDDNDVYIAVVSGYFDEMFDKRLLDCVDDFLAKPFDVAVFKLKVFLWAIKYKRRLANKKRLVGEDFKVKVEILEV